MRRIFYAAVLIVVLGGCGSRAEQIPDAQAPIETAETPLAAPNPDAWKLEIKAEGFVYNEDDLTYEEVWSDEFGYEGLPDPSKWSFETGGGGWGNNELEYYTDGKNALVTGGKLIITARKEDMGGRDVTSSRMVTRGKGDWLYGKIEVSAKLPAGLGTWPAVWMMPSDSEYGGWPDSGEIDIMEHVGYNQDIILATVHTREFNHVKGTQKGKSSRFDGVSEGFHVYTAEWLPDKIRFSVDGEELFVFEPQKLITEATYRHWPFDKKFFLILNVAFGGNLGGAKGVDYACLPAVMEVDYVRVYQAKEITEITK